MTKRLFCCDKLLEHGIGYWRYREGYGCRRIGFFVLRQFLRILGEAFVWLSRKTLLFNMGAAEGGGGAYVWKRFFILSSYFEFERDEFELFSVLVVVLVLRFECGLWEFKAVESDEEKKSPRRGHQYLGLNAFYNMF